VSSKDVRDQYEEHQIMKRRSMIDNPIVQWPFTSLRVHQSRNLFITFRHLPSPTKPYHSSSERFKTKLLILNVYIFVISSRITQFIP